ncbi:DNA-binding beta-propeller fold protein YncE [Paenibacillus tianmuensis]|uniref:DNA-binding beta-propeller fold protein YncE n=1 Tax=Paenibacillus tianmuensis TaxID=624147 RepID=A0A1G4TIA2_9BACL|nr:S-layer homology domain-containing protein [Paenibacillus tianmuensis]SCW80545.1 DNA-binding beta-propeller fold protein YncE [Paenibacillus tianmuensis]
MTNRGEFHSFAGRLWIWTIVFMMVSVTLFHDPAHAAEQWSQYAKIGRGSNDVVGAFSTPNGLTVDGGGNLYVADTGNNRIQKLTAATGLWSQWGKNAGAFGTRLGEFANPASVSVDRSGNVYAADTGNHRIQKLTAATGEWSEWKSSGGGSGSGLGEFRSPKGVAVDSRGNVYVADAGNHRIQKLTVATSEWSEWKKTGGGPGSGRGEFNGPARVSVDGSDNIYVADTGNHRIQKLTAATGEWSEWKSGGGGSGSGLGEFNNPSDIAVDGSGDVYVADTGNHRIQKLTIASGVWSEWKSSAGVPGSSLGTFKNPRGVAVDGSGNIYVGDTGNARVQKLDVRSNSWSEWIYIGGVIGGGLGEFKYPNGVAVDSKGNAYVADFGNHRIQKFDAATRVWIEWRKSNGQFGSGLGEFDGPTDVAVDSSGNVYVSDFYNHRVQKLTVATGVWSEWKKSGGGAGSGPGEFNYPSGVAVDGDGNVYVADSDNNRIQKLTAATGKWSDWKKSDGKPGSSLGEFNYPTGVAVDRSGNVYVADMKNHRIQKLTAATGVWSEWKSGGGGSGSGLGGFDEPYHLAVDGNGNVYVADSNNHRIQKLTAATGKWREWKRRGGGAGGGLGEFYNPLGVAVDSSGQVYVADSNNHRVQKLEGQNTPPDAPTNVTAEVANGELQATVKFTAPVSDGGSAITGYTVTSSPGGLTASGTGSPITVTGLTYGTAYTFTVVATNDLGDSNASLPSNSVTPAPATAPVTVPGAPTAVTAVVEQGQSQATVTFTPPASNGGSLITGYTVTSSPGGLTASGTGSPITVTGLTYGTTYTFTVVAMNGTGSSAPSTPSNGVTPIALVAVPSAPRNVTAVAGNGEATVTFTPPARDGGSPIVSYTVTANPGGKTATGAGSPVTVTGLTNGVTYTFTVVATNRVGSGAASHVSNAVRPEGSSDSGSSDNTPTTGSASFQPGPSAPAESDTSGASVLVNGQSVNAGTVKVTNVDSRKVTTVTLDRNKLEERLAKEGKSAVVTIPVNTASDVVIAELTGQMVSGMEAQQAVLEIKTDRAAYRLPARQINIQSISNQVGGSAALQDIKVQIEIAVPKKPVPSLEGTIAIVAPPLDFAVRAIYKDKTVEVTEFQTYVERTMAIPDGVDPNKITTGVAIETDGTLRHVPTKVVLSNGKYYAKINSLTNSVYSVIWHPLAFKDVERHWAQQAVNDMGSRLVVSGVSQGQFNPDQDITRAEFAAILIRGLGLKAKEGAQPFSDVDRKDWFCGAVGTAYAYNLISGFEDGAFRPNEKITREQAMTIMAIAMTITGLSAKSSPTAEPLLNSFADAGTVSDWAKSGISDALQSGLLSGRSGTELAPKAFITRAEVAVIVQRLLQKSDLIQ